MEAEAEVKKEQTAQAKEKNPKKEHEKKQRPKRQNQHQYNADLITETTVIPPLPKKGEIIPKPDIQAYKEREKKNSKRIEDIINKKKDIRTEKFKFNRNKGQTGQGDSVFSAFNSQVSEVQQLRDKLNEVKVERNKLGDELHEAIQKAKANNENIKNYKEALKGSRENFQERLRDLEHRQMTKELSKNEEKEINNEIMLLKRKIKEAESSGNIQIKLEQAQDLKEELDETIEKVKALKEPLDKEYTSIRDQLDKKNTQITNLKGEMAAEKSEKSEEKERHDKQYEDWKAGKKVRLDKLEEEITKLKQENNKLWDEYHKKLDEHWKQKYLIDYIQWQNRVKNRKIAEKEKEARKAEFERRDKEREKEQKLQKYLGEIELINFLINYLNGLKGQSKVEEEKKEAPKVSHSEISAKITGDAQWKKEKVQVLTSKKSREEEEPEKKHKKKNKKKEETKVEDKKFLIPFNVQTMFESVKLLAPSSVQQIDAKIKELKDREALFQRVAQEQSSQEETKLAEQIKSKQSVKGEKGKKEKKAEQEQQFPTI